MLKYHKGQAELHTITTGFIEPAWNIAWVRDPLQNWRPSWNYSKFLP